MRNILKGLDYIGAGLGIVIICIACILCMVRWIKAKRNPSIVFLHGGPGNTIAPLSYYYQPELEDQFTFINWDQRESGRTYYKNSDLDVKSQLSTEILLEDLDELVDYI